MSIHRFDLHFSTNPERTGYTIWVLSDNDALLINWLYRTALFVPDYKPTGWTVSCFLDCGLPVIGIVAVYGEIPNITGAVAEPGADAELMFICELKLGALKLLCILKVGCSTGSFGAVELLLYMDAIAVGLVS